MAAFNTFSDILPDPVNRISVAGSPDAAGDAGPGFARVKLGSNQDAQVSRTNSGRGVHTSSGSHYWEISITYHPMTREEFDPVDTFLLSRGNARLNPFYVILPQNSRPKMVKFAEFAEVNAITVRDFYNAGTSVITLRSPIKVVGSPLPGDVFNIVDPTNTNHQKVYKITRVETTDLSQAGMPVVATNEIRVHIAPPLERNVAANSPTRFINPRFRVIVKGNVQEYELDTDNLYQFGLNLEEIQP